MRAINLAAPQIAQWRASVTGVPQNHPPDAVNDSASTDAGQAVTVNVLQNDSDPDNHAITISAVSNPTHGQAEIQTSATRIVYTPDAGFVGKDGFTYTIMDSKGETDTASVSVQVRPAPSTPPPSVPPTGGNLIANGGAESGLIGWSGGWGARVKLDNDAHSGSRSVSTIGGRGAFVDVTGPLEVNRNLAVAGWLKAKVAQNVYVYLLLKEGSRWKAKYMTSVSLAAGQWKQFDQTRYVRAGNVAKAKVLFYRRSATDTKLLIDDATLSKK